MKGRILITTVIAVISTSVYVQSVIAEKLEIPGSGACEVVLNDLAAAFHALYPGDEIIIPQSIGTNGGFNAVIADKNLIARVARAPIGEEAKHHLNYLVFAKDAVTFAVGTSVEVRNLTTAQLVEIFSGKIDNWQKVGGNNAFIRVLIRQPGESSLTIIEQNIKAFQKLTFTTQSKILYHDYEMVEMLVKYKTAIGWLTNSSISAPKIPIKALAIDGIEPSAENVLSGRYRLICEYALTYKPNQLNNLEKKFIDFIFSDSGKQIMKKHGVIPFDKRTGS